MLQHFLPTTKRGIAILKAISLIADILGILSFLLSLHIVQRLSIKANWQKEVYREERVELLSTLQALRENIWTDGIISSKIQDHLCSKLFEYRIKFLLISTPVCWFHLSRCLSLLKPGISSKNSEGIRYHLNYIIASLSKEE